MASASDKKLDQIIKELSEIGSETKKIPQIVGTLQVIDKRLLLIEQRLTNIEEWIPVDNSHLRYTGEKTSPLKRAK